MSSSEEVSTLSGRAVILDLEGKAVGEVDLPPVFRCLVRADLIRRAYLSALTARIQPQGRDPMAGKRTSAESWGAGRGVSRVPRVKGRGYPKAASGARAAMTVGGVRVHAPRVGRVVWERINKKERELAIKSAIAATADIGLVGARHRIDGLTSVPLVVEDSLEGLERTADVYSFLERIGLGPELRRAKSRFRKIRAGRGKMRGRKRKSARGPLIIYRRDGGIFRASRNIPGVDVSSVDNLNVPLLAPGGIPGRLAIYTVSALDRMRERW